MCKVEVWIIDHGSVNSEHHITFRKATIDDHQMLESWLQKPHVLENVPDESWGWETELLREPEWREMLIAELHGKPMGFLQIIDPALEETRYWGDVSKNLRAIDIWIGEEALVGKGYGTQMMKKAFDRCFSAPDVTAIIIDPLASNERGIRFYQRLGFEFLRTEWFDGYECAVHKLTRQRWELLHNRKQTRH